MGRKQIKGASTLTGVVMSLLIVIGFFLMGFSYLDGQVTQSGVTIDAKYNETYTRLETSQGGIEDNVDAIKDNLNDIKEAETTYQVAWNGLKGLGNTLKLPVRFISSTNDVAEAMDSPLDVVPPKIKTLIMIGITAFVVLLVLSLLKGEQRL